MPEQTDTTSMNLTGIICELKNGSIRIPDFQRDYIWTPDQVLELLDTIWNGYPIGSILLWKTNMCLKELDPLNLKLKEFPEEYEKLYLLDGQQRLVTLYGVLHGNLELGKKKKIKYRVYFDLKKKEFNIYKREDIDNRKELDPKIEDWFLPLEELITINYQTRATSQNNELITKYSIYPDLLNAYVDLFLRFNSLSFPAITNGQDLAIATKIFERLNNTGSPLNIVDLMVASTYKPDFNLREEIKEVLEELDSKNFGFPEKIILQCASACSVKGIKKDDIVNSSPYIEDNWINSIKSLRLAINFLKKHCAVQNSRFIPNTTLIIPLTYFFYKKPTLQLSQDLIKRLKRFFWLGIFSERYVQSQDTKIEKDIKDIETLLSDNTADVFNHFVDISWEDIKFTDLSFASSFSSAVMCFLASKEPLEFKNNEVVDLGLTFGEENQKELHHIFPKNFLKKKLLENSRYNKTIKPFINSVANISLISRVTNRSIWDKAPSIYFDEFKKQNSDINKSLQSHLIDDLESFGILNDEYELFVDKRAKKISEEIKCFVEELKKD